jgi:hypothetical protein
MPSDTQTPALPGWEYSSRSDECLHLSRPGGPYARQTGGNGAQGYGLEPDARSHSTDASHATIPNPLDLGLQAVARQWDRVARVHLEVLGPGVHVVAEVCQQRLVRGLGWNDAAR